MKRYFTPLIFLLIMTSCQKKKNAPIVLSSSGNINTITVVMTDQLWAGKIGQAVRDMYAYPSEGLPHLKTGLPQPHLLVSEFERLSLLRLTELKELILVCRLRKWNFQFVRPSLWQT